MSTEPNKSLIRGVVRLHDKADRGDPAAQEQLRSVSAAAADGDLSAEAAMNTLAVVHFVKKSPRTFKKAGVMLELIEQKDPTALNWVLDIQRQAKDGDHRALRILSMLNAHKDKNVASAWAAPVDSEDGNTRTRNTPMTFGSNRRSTIVGAATSDVAASVVARQFIRMTPEDEQRLTTMMLRGAASRSTNAATEAAILAAKSAGSRQSLGEQMQGFATLTIPQPATADELVAYKATLTDNALRFSAGEYITRLNPAIAAFRTSRGQGDDWDLGFYIGLATSLGNTVSGPGQDAIRDSMFGDLRNEPMRGSLRHKGFAEARTIMYDIAANKRPLFLPHTIKGVGRVRTDGESIHASFTGPQAICDSAASALARNSAAAPGLIAQCVAVRRANIMKGLYIADGLSPDDPAYRVALTDAGEAILAKNPKMAQFRATLPANAQQRGFTMAMGARAGQVDPKFVAFVTPGLSRDPELLRGFLDGMNM